MGRCFSSSVNGVKTQPINTAVFTLQAFPVSCFMLKHGFKSS